MRELFCTSRGKKLFESLFKKALKLCLKIGRCFVFLKCLELFFSPKKRPKHWKSPIKPLEMAEVAQAPECRGEIGRLRELGSAQLPELFVHAAGNGCPGQESKKDVVFSDVE